MLNDQNTSYKNRQFYARTSHAKVRKGQKKMDLKQEELVDEDGIPLINVQEEFQKEEGDHRLDGNINTSTKPGTSK